jgi:hypothetical protein
MFFIIAIKICLVVFFITMGSYIYTYIKEHRGFRWACLRIIHSGGRYFI